MNRLFAVAFFGLINFAPAYAADGIYLHGHGKEKCHEWNLARTPPISDSDIHEQHSRLEWIQGYLGASAQYRDKQLLRGVTPENVVELVNVYCAVNPNATIYWAADAVAEALLQAAIPVS